MPGADMESCDATPTGIDSVDLLIGRYWAEHVICESRQTGTALPIAVALVRIIEAGRLGNIEAGFVARISEAARAGSLN